jgi:plastocyanin
MVNHPRSAIVLLGFALVIVTIGIAAFVLHESCTSASVPSSLATRSAATTPPSAAVIQQLRNSHGFQAFVSYTNGSFQPGTTTIKVRQTVRFTNNSPHDIWVGQITTNDTPDRPDTEHCDVLFNSCRALRPGDFSEFTFTASGTYYYMDNLDTATRGAVIVK